MKKMIKKFSTLNILFLAIFLLLNFYYLVIKSELYESKTLLVVKDLVSNSSTSSLGLSLLGMGTSSQLQDSKIIEEYLKSLDVYLRLDEKFNLTDHYRSDELDFVQRLSANAKTEDFLRLYNAHLTVYYDEISSLLNISFRHVDAKKAQEVLEFLVQEAEAKLNEINRKTSQKKLAFIEQEYQKAKTKMENSSKRLEDYQNTHLLLDPSTQASATSGVISELEATLIQKQIEYATAKNYLNEDSHELQVLKNEIDEIKKSIAAQKRELSGTSKDRLNKILFEYEKLKLQLEFDTEVYKNALLQLESTKLEVSKEAKTLSVIVKPNLADGYTYPNKPKVFITILVVMLILYGIISLLISIIRDHKE